MNTAIALDLSQPCPCGSQMQLIDCCHKLLSGQGVANRPEQLMRSRYTAFYFADAAYLYKTSSENLKQQLTVDALKESAVQCQFIKLEILNFADDWVEFSAHLIADDEYQTLHEKSTFVLEQGEWKYDSGQLFPTSSHKLKRNDSCPCGSGKKYKKCHLR